MILNASEKEMKSLENLEWLLGIEHEMQVYHTPNVPDNSNKKISDFILFDSESAVNRAIEAYKRGEIEYTNDEYDILRNTVFESSGRVCNRKHVVSPAPYNMPEFITKVPLCTIRTRRNIHNLTGNIIEEKDIFLDLISREKVTKKLIKKYGKLTGYPYGMTRYMTVPKKIENGEYKFSIKKDKKRFIRTDYTGSYHITFTLPHTKRTSEKTFIKDHMNFANQIQWLEPLMLVGFFSGDEYAIGSKKERVRGSFRVMIIGWGNLVGSDVRLFEKVGIGRYAKTPIYWRKGLKFFESEKLDPCIAPSPKALEEKGTTSLSSNLRTFGSTDPNRPEHRESGLPMTKPNGIEIRIFDNFKDTEVEYLTNFIGLIAENSRVTKTKGYVYQDKDWIEATHRIMKNGYSAILPKEYIKKLRTKLGLKIKTKSVIAQDVFNTVYQEIFEKNIHGKWSKLFFGTGQGLKHTQTMMRTFVPEINLDSTLFAFMLKCNRNPEILHSFNKLSTLLNELLKEGDLEYKKVEEYVVKIMGKEWKKNTTDLINFYDLHDYIVVNKNEDGTINNIHMINNIPIFNNFNEYIKEEFYSPELNDPFN